MSFRPLLLSGLLLGLGMLGLGCAKDESVVPDPNKAPSPKVENGDVYDKAILNAGDIKTLIVPDSAIVERTAKEGQVELYLKKTLSFGGHPPEPMPLVSIRKDLGCAARAQNIKVLLGTFGEGSSKEGGAYLKPLIRVPAALAVETEKGLSGSDSQAQKNQKGHYLFEEPVPNDSPEHALISAGPDWKRIPTEPDPQRTAK
jgi:hypothetical protein